MVKTVLMVPKDLQARMVHRDQQAQMDKMVLTALPDRKDPRGLSIQMQTRWMGSTPLNSSPQTAVPLQATSMSTAACPLGGT